MDKPRPLKDTFNRPPASSYEDGATKSAEQTRVFVRCYKACRSAQFILQRSRLQPLRHTAAIVAIINIT